MQPGHELAVNSAFHINPHARISLGKAHNPVAQPAGGGNRAKTDHQPPALQAQIGAGGMAQAGRINQYLPSVFRYRIAQPRQRHATGGTFKQFAAQFCFKPGKAF